MTTEENFYGGFYEIAETLEILKTKPLATKSGVRIRSRSKNLELAVRQKDSAATQYPVSDVEIDLKHEAVIVKQYEDDQYPYFAIYPFKDIEVINFCEVINVIATT